MFDFNNDVIIGADLKTTFLGKELVLKNVYNYEGPVTLQSLPYGGIQSVFGYSLIINTKNGFISCDYVIYNGEELSTKEFVLKYDNLVNLVLPN